MSGVLPGSKIAVFSPSDHARITMPRRFRSGLDWLSAQGFQPQVMPYAGMRERFPDPRERACDLLAAIDAPDIPLAVATVGGNSAVALLPHLDAQLLANRPTVLQGGSDVTTLLWWAHHATALPMYYGPMLCLGMAEEPEPMPETRRGLELAWSDSGFHCTPSVAWTEERVPFDAPWDAAASAQARRLSGLGGWRVLQEGAAGGTLLAGCLEVLVWYVRTLPAWELLQRGEVILALDIALMGTRWGSSPLGGPANVDTLLHAFGQSGGWNNVAGLLVGRPRGYSFEERLTLDRVVRSHAPKGIPVVMDLDLGHTEPTLTLPLGSRAEVDTSVPVISIDR